jgi:MFS family permease
MMMLFSDRFHSFASRPRFLFSTIFIWISVTSGRFLAPFLEHYHGMNSTQIGIALGIQVAVDMLVASFAGQYADRREQHYPKRGRAQVMALGIVGGTAVFLGHALFASAAWHALMQALFAVCTAALLPVLDGLTIDYLPRASEYGKERLFAAIAWASTHIVLGYLLEYVGFKVIYPLVILSGLLALCSLYIFVQCQIHPRQLLRKRDSDELDFADEISFKHAAAKQELQTMIDTEANMPVKLLDDETEIRLSTPALFRLLVASVYSAVFFLALFCLSSGQSVVDNLIFLFFETLGSSYVLMGYTIVLTVAFEIPIFQVADSWLETYGAGNMLLLAAFCYCGRVVGYSYIPANQVAWVLFLEPLHGITYACTQSSLVHFAGEALPPGYEATSQGLANVFRGLGSMSGVFIGGYAMDAFGPRITYRAFACIVLFGSLIFAWAQKFRAPSLHRCLSDVSDEDVVELVAEDGPLLGTKHKANSKASFT